MRPAGILSTSWSSAAASTARMSTGVPLRAIACASHDATSATAQAWRTDHAGGSRDSSRLAASRRAGTVMPGIVAGAARARGVDHQPVRPQVHHDGPVEVRAVHAGPDVAAGARGSRAPGARSRCRRPTETRAKAGAGRVEQGGAGRRGAPVVGHLEDVDPREAAGDQPRVHVVLGVAGEQEATAVRLAEQDDRRVVDAAARGRGLDGHRLAPARGRVSVTSSRRSRAPAASVARGGPWRSACVPGVPARARAVHPGLEDPAHPVALQDADEAGDVVLVRDASARRGRSGDPTAGRGRRAPVSSRSGSGPPSTSIRPPARLSTRIASPCPTSSITRRVVRPAVSARAMVESATTIAATTASVRAPREAGVRKLRGIGPPERVVPFRKGGQPTARRVRRARARRTIEGAASDQRGGHERRRRPGLGRDRDSGERQAGGDPHDRHDDVQQQPGRQPEDRRQRCPGGRASPGRHRPWPGRRRPSPREPAGRPRG